MFHYLERKAFVKRILFLLEFVKSESSSLCHKPYSCTLKNNVLCITIPSKDKHLYSRFERDIDIQYDVAQQKIVMSYDPFGINASGESKTLIKKLNEFVKKMTELNALFEERASKAHIYERIVAHDVKEEKKRDREKKRSSLFKDMEYASSDNDSYTSHHDNSSD